MPKAQSGGMGMLPIRQTGQALHTNFGVPNSGFEAFYSDFGVANFDIDAFNSDFDVPNFGVEVFYSGFGVYSVNCVKWKGLGKSHSSC